MKVQLRPTTTLKKTEQCLFIQEALCHGLISNLATTSSMLEDYLDTCHWADQVINLLCDSLALPLVLHLLRKYAVFLVYWAKIVFLEMLIMFEEAI